MSERECYRAFRTCLHMTPAEYMRNYRLQMACRLLAEGVQPVTEIGYACRTGKRQPFWKTVPGLCGLHAAGLSEKM
ncbi:MAG: helix-turn-helix domain-containing protein [Lachnospiraceae bacterium]